MRKNNSPQSGLDEIEPEVTQQMVMSLKELYDRGKPATDAEVEKRIDDYFEFCQRSSVRPGIESLCMSLHISRTTLFRWNNGENCSKYRQELIQSAKSLIAAFLEQALMCGKISPPCGIFLAKNWLGYSDTISLESIVPKTDNQKVLSSGDIRKLISKTE